LLDRIRRRLSFANVISVISLFVALGGGAYAAGLVGPGDIAKNAVLSKHVKNGQIKRGDQARDQQTDWAVVNADHTIAAQSGGISVLDVGGPQTGEYHLRFPVKLGTRPITATIHGGLGAIGEISATRCGTTPPGGEGCQLGLDQHHVFVKTTNSSGGAANMKFIVAVLPK
jgi:hypothetical protein